MSKGRPLSSDATVVPVLVGLVLTALVSLTMAVFLGNTWAVIVNEWQGLRALLGMG